MTHSLTAVVESDDILGCDPAPFCRFLGAGRHIWLPSPGRVIVWRDDVDDDGAVSAEPLVLGYWTTVLRVIPHLPYMMLPGGRCVLELFAAACGPGSAQIDDGIVVVDTLWALTALAQWSETIRRTGEEYGADPDAVDRHVEELTVFLRNAVTWR